MIYAFFHAAKKQKPCYGGFAVWLRFCYNMRHAEHTTSILYLVWKCYKNIIFALIKQIIKIMMNNFHDLLVSRCYRALLLLLSVNIWGINNAQTLILGTDTNPQSGCAMTIYDNGGQNGNYMANRNDLLTIQSNSTDPLLSAIKVTINLSRFNVHPSDTLFIYDGPNVVDSMLLAALNDSLITEYGTTTISFAATMRNLSGDITLRFKTDSLNEGGGFEINASCTRLCQRINIAFDTLLSNKYPVLQADGFHYLDVCPGETVHLVTRGMYPDNNVNYTQSDQTCTFVWDLGVETFDSLGMATLDYTFPEGRGYDVSLLIKDQRECESANRSMFRVRTSSNPIRAVVSFPGICLGDTIDLTYGYDESSHIQVDTIKHEQLTTLAVADTIFLPDGIPCNGTCSYLSPVTFTAFSPNAKITSVNDIFYVQLAIEHSYIGDIWIRLICPNGQYSSIMKWSGSGSAQCSSQIPQSARGWNASGFSGAFFGNYFEPDGSDECDPAQNTMGTCWNYCWSNNTTQGYSYACGNSYVYENCNHINGNYVDSTNTRMMTNVYHPDDNFYTSLQNCPLNGTWSIEVMDGWSSDNGYVCGWELALNPALVPQNWSYDVTVDTALLIGTNSDGNIAVPTESGAINYTARVIDNLNCNYDTSMTIIVNHPQENELRQTVCGSVVWNGQVYTESGEYQQTLTATSGCDSTVTLHLTMLQPAENTITHTNCGSYEWNGQQYSQSGTYSRTLTAANGCDSTVTLHLTVLQPAENTITHTNCDSFEWNGETYTQSGTYSRTLTAANGCDSTVTLHLTVLQPAENTITHTNCDSFEWNGETYTQSGTYSRTLTAANGCDSTVTLHLTVLQTPQMDIVSNYTICHGDSLAVNFFPVSPDVSFNWTVSDNPSVSGIGGAAAPAISARYS